MFTTTRTAEIGVSDSDLAQSILGLTSLETHYLEDNIITLECEEAPEAADLDLKGLSWLLSLSLNNVVPAPLILPKGAALHLEVTWYPSLMEYVWHESASNWKSVYVWDLDETYISEKSELPSFLVG